MASDESRPEEPFQLVKGKRGRKSKVGNRKQGLRERIAFLEIQGILITGTSLILVGPATVATLLLIDPALEFQWSTIFIVALLAMPTTILLMTALTCLWVSYEWRRLLREIQEKKERKKKFRLVG